MSVTDLHVSTRIRKFQTQAHTTHTPTHWETHKSEQGISIRKICMYACMQMQKCNCWMQQMKAEHNSTHTHLLSDRHTYIHILTHIQTHFAAYKCALTAKQCYWCTAALQLGSDVRIAHTPWQPLNSLMCLPYMIYACMCA